MDILRSDYKETVEFHMRKACEAMSALVPGDWDFTLDLEHEFLFAVNRATHGAAITEGRDVAIIVRLSEKRPTSPWSGRRAP
ncbi:hypothetical protein [Rhizobium rhizogenes]|uniref:hypothetical protein n=1 Tax=Rhizobium rhizogenes TaxID=359 RepID=UPI00157325BB|nr:hypothetical protein [Rhizobium rhizogenes]NTF80825.1 hypothetical protein [Rhizobium rhizogenes]NTI74237.1 hypothetical protein [Rhizobium rhizogenes]